MRDFWIFSSLALLSVGVGLAFAFLWRSVVDIRSRVACGPPLQVNDLRERAPLSVIEWELLPYNFYGIAGSWSEAHFFGDLPCSCCRRSRCGVTINNDNW